MCFCTFCFVLYSSFFPPFLSLNFSLYISSMNRSSRFPFSLLCVYHFIQTNKLRMSFTCEDDLIHERLRLHF